jgi:hypothetical protein
VSWQLEKAEEKMMNDEVLIKLGSVSEETKGDAGEDIESVGGELRPFLG